ncbi:MAG: transposase, partial [Nanoarchaeota archaeon]|nr:transposase [Nanoarchaeota archaeon]
MGKPNLRLNPLVESRCEKILLETSASMLLALATLLPEKKHCKRGQRPHDYRVILCLCILRILFRKTYKDYEIETRNDSRLCLIFGMEVLPSRSSLQRGMEMFSMKLLRKYNYMLIKKHLYPRINALLDASGIRIIGRSIWYSIRIKKKISRKECDKIHIAICHDQMLILNWFITKGKRNDCPFFVRLLKPFRKLGLVMADPGYLSRKNVQFVADRGGAAFIWIKKNVTLKGKGSFAWRSMIRL